ncbi:MAG: hypothetical protein ABUJ93_07625 [Hyphomicrobium sp.]
MNKTLIVACAVAGGLFAALAAPPPAQALPSVSLGIEKNADAVMHLARRGGGGRGMRGRSFGGGRGMRVCAGTVADVSFADAVSDVVASFVDAVSAVVASLATGATANVAFVAGAIAGCGVTTMAMLRMWLEPTIVGRARG